jgi:two-component system, chemotaxis family, chemotaxis protein CheY
MKTLIVEDDFTSRFLLQKFLAGYGPCFIAVNGKEAVEAVQTALENNEPYDLVCMDIMMPEMDGQTALQQIRQLEQDRRIASTDGMKVIMTTALTDMQNVSKAYSSLCDGYLVKPIDKAKLEETIRQSFR